MNFTASSNQSVDCPVQFSSALAHKIDAGNTAQSAVTTVAGDPKPMSSAPHTHRRRASLLPAVSPIRYGLLLIQLDSQPRPLPSQLIAVATINLPSPSSLLICPAVICPATHAPPCSQPPHLPSSACPVTASPAHSALHLRRRCSKSARALPRKSRLLPSPVKPVLDSATPPRRAFSSISAPPLTKPAAPPLYHAVAAITTCPVAPFCFDRRRR